ncbi:MAG: HAD family phosphatase [Candidatus Aenigmarchaeota archaeon]|nr:HAD family phosphatase [Candidatus Aenigmarchaeota archaeon]
MSTKQTRPKYKIVVFDLDGTLADGTASIWRTILESLGINEHPRRIELRDKFRTGEIGYREWAEGDMKLMVEYGVNRDKVLKALDRVKLMKGARETLDALKAKGMKLAIVSGSMDVVLEKIIPDYKKLFDYVYILKIFFDGKGSVKGIDTCHDAWNKDIALREICAAERIPLEECVFVGDHSNDVSASKIAGLAIAFDPKSDKLKAVADVVIEKKDMREILKHI